MRVYDAIMNRRSIRKFSQTPILHEDLLELVRCAGMAAYPANVQPLKFALIEEKETCKEIFACTKWAGYLKNGAPEEDKRPTAYLVILGDASIKGGELQVEVGAAGMTVTLAALEKGIASCWLGALDRERIAEILALPEHLKVKDVIALGYPAQKSRPEEIKDGDVKYYLDEEDILHVPKRSLEEILYCSFSFN